MGLSVDAVEAELWYPSLDLDSSPHSSPFVPDLNLDSDLAVFPASPFSSPDRPKQAYHENVAEFGNCIH